MCELSYGCAKVFLDQARRTKWKGFKTIMLNAAAKNRREHLEYIRQKLAPKEDQLSLF